MVSHQLRTLLTSFFSSTQLIKKYGRKWDDKTYQENFANIINVYRPKLIVPWNGRLESIGNFNEVLNKYRILDKTIDRKKIYIRIDK